MSIYHNFFCCWWIYFFQGFKAFPSTWNIQRIHTHTFTPMYIHMDTHTLKPTWHIALSEQSNSYENKDTICAHTHTLSHSNFNFLIRIKITEYDEYSLWNSHLDIKYLVDQISLPPIRKGSHHWAISHEILRLVLLVSFCILMPGHERLSYLVLTWFTSLCVLFLFIG